MLNNAMNKIILITTKGCEGCSVMRANTTHAVTTSRIDIEFEIKDVSELDKKALRTYGIKDFPTILFFKDNALKHKYIGSMPSIVITRWIDIYFK